MFYNERCSQLTNRNKYRDSAGGVCHGFGWVTGSEDIIECLFNTL